MWTVHLSVPLLFSSFLLKIEPMDRKISETIKSTRRQMNAMFVVSLVGSANNGVRLMANMNPKKLAVRLISPQLMLSLTPNFTVYMTANSYATNRIGIKKKPIAEHAT